MSLDPFESLQKLLKLGLDTFPTEKSALLSSPPPLQTWGKENRYVLKEILSLESQGILFKALDTHTQEQQNQQNQQNQQGQEVLLYLLRLNQNYPEAHFHSFIQAFQELALIQHPNLIPLGEASTHVYHGVTLPFYTLKASVSCTFQAFFKTPTPLKFLLKSLIQLSQGIEALHQRGLCYGTLEPYHLFWDPHGRLLVHYPGALFSFFSPAPLTPPSISLDIQQISAFLFQCLRNQLPFKSLSTCQKEIEWFYESLHDKSSLLKKLEFEIEPALLALCSQPFKEESVGALTLTEFIKNLNAYLQERQSWRFHFFQKLSQKPLLLESDYGRILKNEKKEIVFLQNEENPSFAFQHLADYFKIGDTYVLTVKTPLSLNGKLLGVGAKKELEDGSWIQVETSIFRYIRGKTAEFYSE
jgi:hypothetical protein